MTYYYRAFNLNIASELACPTLPIYTPGISSFGEAHDPKADAAYMGVNEEAKRGAQRSPKLARRGVYSTLPFDSVDLSIQLGAVPHTLDNTSPQSKYTYGDAHQLVLYIPKLARLWIQNGNRITIELEAEAEPDLELLWVYLLGGAMAGILYQRNYCVLHGNAIVLPTGEALVFVGPSGIGKSTLAEGFRQQGYSLLTDDVSAIYWDDQQKPWVLPAYPSLKLWQASADHFLHDTTTLRPIANRETKYHIPFTHDFYPKAAPLAQIIILTTTEHPSTPLQRLSGSNAFTALFSNVYRPPFIEIMQRHTLYFQYCSRLCQQLSVVSLLRPHWPLDKATIDRTLTQLQEHRL